MHVCISFSGLVLDTEVLFGFSLFRIVERISASTGLLVFTEDFSFHLPVQASEEIIEVKLLGGDLLHLETLCFPLFSLDFGWSLIAQSLF